MATVRIETERVLRICTDALAHVERNQPALDEAIKFFDENSEPRRSAELASTMARRITDLKQWQAAAQLACEPVVFDSGEALCLQHAGSPEWSACIRHIIESSAAIQAEKLAAFGLKAEDFVPRKSAGSGQRSCGSR